MKQKRGKKVELSTKRMPMSYYSLTGTLFTGVKITFDPQKTKGTVDNNWFEAPIWLKIVNLKHNNMLDS